MAQPLALSYNWRAPLVFATVALVACIGILVRGQAVGWLSAAVVLVLCWAAYCGWSGCGPGRTCWSRARC